MVSSVERGWGLKVVVKGYGRKKSADTRIKAGKIEITAQDEVEAVLVAMLYRLLCGVGVKGNDGMLRLFYWLKRKMDGKFTRSLLERG
jgi:hypothetical protein